MMLAMSAKGRRGFTFVEIMIALVVLLIAVGIGFYSMASGRTRASVRSAAMEILADLRWARQHAIATLRPAGLMLGAGNCSAAYAVMRASGVESNDPIVERKVDFGSTESLFIFSGTWDELPFTADDAPFTGRPDGIGGPILDAWAARWPGHYVAFGSSGRVVSRGLQNAGGDRYVVVAAGGRVDGSRLAEVGPAYTIRIRPTGETTLLEGVPAHAAVPAALGLPPLGRLPVDLPTQQGRRSNSVPSVQSVIVTPVANVAALPPSAPSGTTFQVRQDGTLVLEIAAIDPDGDRLWCTWGGRVPPQPTDDSVPTVDPHTMVEVGGGVAIGAFSSQGAEPMTWTGSSSTWTSTVEWAPPANARVGSWFFIGAVVDDVRGGKDGGWVAVQVIEPGLPRVAYTTIQRGGGSRGVRDGDRAWICNSAGAEAIEIDAVGPPSDVAAGVDGASDTLHGMSRDGRWLLAATSDFGVRPGRFEWRIVDSLSLQTEQSLPAGALVGQFAPDNTHVTFGRIVMNTVGSSLAYDFEVSILNFDGSNRRILSPTACAYGWGPDGRYWLTERQAGTLDILDLYVYDRWLLTRTMVAHNVESYVVIPSGSAVLYKHKGSAQLYVATDTGGSWTSAASGLSPLLLGADFSADGNWIAWPETIPRGGGNSQIDLHYAPVSSDLAAGNVTTLSDPGNRRSNWSGTGHTLYTTGYRTVGTSRTFIDMIDPATGITRRNAIPGFIPRTSERSP